MKNKEIKKAMAVDIPVIYIEPDFPVKEKKLAIFLHGLGGTKEDLINYLEDMSDKGYIALSYDKYQHGERGTETSEEITKRVFTNLRKYGWPILGQTIIDTTRVIDWAIENLGVSSEVYMGGISMGGDISIAVAGIDRRIVRVAPVVTTPDWLRPGMYKLGSTTEILNPGKADNYAQFFYEEFNPITHLSRYIDTPPMRLQLGRDDTHIPPENAERFKSMLAELSQEAADRIEIAYLEGGNTNHMETIGRSDEWWPEHLNWWLKDNK